MPTRSLPQRSNLEHLRNEARQLQRLVRDGDPGGLALAREFHPRFAERAADFRLSDAQLAVARSYGQASWPRLKAYVEAIARYARNPPGVAVQADAADELLRLACLIYGGDDLSRPSRAAELLRGDPSLASRSIHTAAAVGDVEAAGRLLAADRSLADAAGGPFAWEPILYVAYSRLVSDDPRHSHVGVARLLLEHGGSPHAGYLGGECLFTALTGTFGYGEDSPNQPPHHESIALARLLLEAGADPNDDQTIYNRHFDPENDYLQLLLEYGLGKARRGPWPGLLGDHLTPPELLVEEALVFVADNDRYAERVALLLRHGVDPDGRGTRHPALHGLRPIERAIFGGADENVALLLAAGAQPPELDAVDSLLERCIRGEREAVQRARARDPRLAAALIERHPGVLVDAAEHGNAKGVELLAEVGYDVNRRRIGAAALHLAAYTGNEQLCRRLLELGADPGLRDDAFHARASGWARHAHHDELADWLEQREGRSDAG